VEFIHTLFCETGTEIVLRSLITRKLQPSVFERAFYGKKEVTGACSIRGERGPSRTHNEYDNEHKCIGGSL
jgi:hypothetical protein